MTFRDSHEQLVAQIRKRLQNGEITERSLARQLGVSQSHINNVLRGRRRLSRGTADLVLNSFHYSILDLHVQNGLVLNLNCLPAPEPFREFPVLKQPLGKGQPWSLIEEDSCRPFPFAASTGGECAVFARLLSDPKMESTLSHCDLALIDTSFCARSSDCPACLYVVSRGPDSLVRWVRSGARQLYLADEMTYNRPTAWESIAVTEESRLETIRGRIIWLGSDTAFPRA